MGTVADLERRNREQALARSNKRNLELSTVRDLAVQVASIQRTIEKLQDELRGK